MIAVLLPFALILANWVIGHGVQSSVSGYYYTPMRNIFVGLALRHRRISHLLRRI